MKNKFLAVHIVRLEVSLQSCAYVGEAHSSTFFYNGLKK